MSGCLSLYVGPAISTLYLPNNSYCCCMCLFLVNNISRTISSMLFYLFSMLLICILKKYIHIWWWCGRYCRGEHCLQVCTQILMLYGLPEQSQNWLMISRFDLVWKETILQSISLNFSFESWAKAAGKISFFFSYVLKYIMSCTGISHWHYLISWKLFECFLKVFVCYRIEGLAITTLTTKQHGSVCSRMWS